MAEQNQADAAVWEVRAGQVVGASRHLRDFHISRRHVTAQFRVTLSWNERRLDTREQEDERRDEILRLIREIAAQQDLPIRR